MSLIEVKNLEKIYNDEEAETRALCGVSFGISKGEFVAIMGPSGSGKSTLMHIIGLLDRATKGDYFFEKTNVNTLSDEELAKFRNEKIGFVFQAFNLLTRTTVLDNVKLPLVYSERKIDENRRAKKVIESVGLAHRIGHHTNEISGGEKQRVAVARALVNNPSIILADEPTGNLDSKTGDQVMKILRDLNDAGNTIIVVTHETEVAEFTKRIIYLRDGLVVSDKKVKNRRNKLINK
jgi:putative ABC transport system ATP-binding protein